MEQESVILVASNGVDTRTVSRAAAELSVTIRNMLEDATGDNLRVPLPNVSKDTLDIIVPWLEAHEPKPDVLPDTEEFDRDFTKDMSDELMYDVILAANYLDIHDLLDLVCTAVAEEIKKCKSPEEIRRRFNIKNDFTPEEEEEVRRENAWIDD